MKDNELKASVNRLLDCVEQELRRQNVWMAMPPSPEAMSSTTPFCMDTMTFSQWLQWVFVPRVRAILDQGAMLPNGSDIKPYAEEAIRVEKLEAPELLSLMEQFDRLMS
ncbi:glyoxalase I [Endozoicomonas sp. (ex Bugula neritina AB1)]|nr:glyoxalase I [Endozoicomonas sp. (ex Bugula neritina AB1)]